MVTSLSKIDTLKNIAYDNEALDADDPTLLRNKVSSTDGSIIIVSGFGCSLILNYSVGSSSITGSLVLQTPVGSITLAQVDLSPSNPTLTIGGSVGPFKAQATISFDFSSYILTATGEVCAPFAGCKKGSITVHL